MPVAEKFVSINGEGCHAGKLATFIRFAGCNLDCSFCDTRWANEPDCAVEWWTPQDLANWARFTPAQYVTLTGGEPLLQPLLTELIQYLLEAGKQVEIETNGSVGLLMPAVFRSGLPEEMGKNLTICMDYKLPGSGMESHMLTGNFGMLKPWDVVKFVVGSHDDLFKMHQIIMENSLCDICQVYVGPIMDPGSVNGHINPADIVEFIREMGLPKVTVQLQLHKLIWPKVDKGV